LIETLVTAPVTSQRNVDDWPRWIELGSAVNCATVGAAGGGAAGGAAGGGGGGGGGAGTFFLHPVAKIASANARQMTYNFRLLNMNIAS
jgi:hypothetical protein